jgi:cytochrome c peroxidase
MDGERSETEIGRAFPARLREALRLLLGLSLLSAIAGCGGSAGRAASASTSFVEIELAVILNQLGSLSSEPPDDPTNQYAGVAEAATLGQMFFFDPRYSADGTISCATCHIPEHGFQDNRANTSHGVGFTDRHTPTLINTAFGSANPEVATWQFWDGRKDSLWSSALWSPESPVDMGGTRSKVAQLIYDSYKDAYEAVFGPMPALRDAAGEALAPETALPGTAEWDALDEALRQDITQVFVNFGKAIEAYERKIIRTNSPFDRLFAELSTGHVSSEQLNPSQAAGLKLFIGKGRCISCHYGEAFTDWEFLNTGVQQTGDHLRKDDSGRADGIPQVIADEFSCDSPWSDLPDKRACAVRTLTVRASDTGAFKTPGLRGLSATAPYFHTGTAASLADVIDFYNRGGDTTGYVGTPDRDNIQPLSLSNQEKQSLLDFLNALEGEPLDATLTTAPALPQ